jgi:hypothetical protein
LEADVPRHQWDVAKARKGRAARRSIESVRVHLAERDAKRAAARRGGQCGSVVKAGRAQESVPL